MFGGKTIPVELWKAVLTKIHTDNANGYILGPDSRRIHSAIVNSTARRPLPPGFNVTWVEMTLSAMIREGIIGQSDQDLRYYALDKSIIRFPPGSPGYKPIPASVDSSSSNKAGISHAVTPEDVMKSLL